MSVRAINFNMMSKLGGTGHPAQPHTMLARASSKLISNRSRRTLSSKTGPNNKGG